MDLYDEKNLVKLAKHDPQAFTKLYNQNYSKIFGYILKRVADVEIAKDITSETFLKALKNIKKFKWKNISFSAWLYRIASNEIATFYRKKENSSLPLDNIKEPSSNSFLLEEIIEAEEKLAEHKEFLKIQKTIINLPMKYQEVIVLKFFENKKNKEISEILGIKEGTIKSLISRGLKKLKEQM